MPDTHLLTGVLQRTAAGAVVLRVPAALVRGYYLSIGQPGVRLPDRDEIGLVRVCSAGEHAQIPAERQPRRNQTIRYSPGKLTTVQTRRPGITRIWYVPLRSRDLQDIRRYCGLPEKPFRLIVGYSVSRTPKEAAHEDPASASAAGKSAAAQISRAVAPAAPAPAGGAGGGSSVTTAAARAAAAGYYALLQKTGVLTDLQTARRQTERNPSEAQVQVGNYRKGKLRLHGLEISLENPKGSKRSGTDDSGKQWSVTMAHDYGYIRSTEGRDGDHIDVFIGPEPECELVFVVNQINPATGKFDEHKVLLGFLSEKAARAGYLANYEKGWRGLGSIRPMTLPDFREWLAKPANLRKEAAESECLCPS